jgi:hypothetical protein
MLVDANGRVVGQGSLADSLEKFGLDALIGREKAPRKR